MGIAKLVSIVFVFVLVYLAEDAVRDGSGEGLCGVWLRMGAPIGRDRGRRGTAGQDEGRHASSERGRRVFIFAARRKRLITKKGNRTRKSNKEDRHRTPNKTEQGRRSPYSSPRKSSNYTRQAPAVSGCSIHPNIKAQGHQPTIQNPSFSSYSIHPYPLPHPNRRVSARIKHGGNPSARASNKEKKTTPTYHSTRAQSSAQCHPSAICHHGA